MDGGHSLRIDVTVRELMELFLQSPLVAGVTRHQESLLDLQWLEVPDMALEEVEYLSSSMICRLRRVLIEQDHCRKLVVTMTQEWNTSIRPSEDMQHLAVELADTKATLSGVRQELEEKTKQLSDTRHQLYQLVLELQEARHNNMELVASAQATCPPLPELDSLREKARHVKRLEMEAMGLRQKEKDIDFYACPAMLTASLCGDLGTMTQVRTGDDYSVDTKGHLQEHWIWYWIDKLFEREEENVQLKLKLHHLQLDRDTDQKCLEELREENMALKTAQGQSVEESAHLRWELEQLSEEAEAEAPGIWALTPLCSSASSCFLKLDQEKQSLQGTIQGLPEASLARQESSLQRRELEEENQQLRKQIEDLRVQMEREKQTSQDLEILSEELMEEREQLLCDIETLKAERAQEIEDLRVQMEREKQTSQDLEILSEELVEEREQLLRDIETLKAEKAQEFKDLKKLVHSLRDSSQTSSKARMKGRKTEQKVLLQTVTDTKRKVTMMEWERRQLCRDLEQVKAQAAQAQELEHMKELHRLQEENEKLAMEVSALTTAPERVHALEWESQDLLLENQRLQTSLDTLQPEGLERDKQLDTRVENSTLCPQSASLTALIEKNTQLQHQQLAAAHEALQREHACLGALHEHLSGEHEALMDEYSRQKTLLRRTLELESKVLSDRYKDQLQHKAALEQLGTLLTTEREALQQEQRTSAMATEENQRLQGELDSYDADDCWAGAPASSNTSNPCNWLREELQSRDISLTELGNHCQLLSHLKGNLEGENRHLQSQNQRLKEQNKRLLQEDVENKDQHQEQQRQYVEKLNALQRQNETLEEKSMAQRKFHDPAPKKKKHWIGVKALVKLIKLKKGGSRERRKSTSESPPWPLGSSDQASPSTSQPLQSQLEPLQATPCCSKGSEEQDTRRGPKDKGLQ
ncbi:protein Daple-like [Myotis lucifugus]|uniref:protein Daple-like n=1 Tax=Myotis lucifugus TaxID=59463 RepID=UPI000CCC5CD0|nr:protein Daple-like [Myotis lucifugus]